MSNLIYAEKIEITDRLLEYLVLASFGLLNYEIAKILCVEETAVKQALSELCIRLYAVNAKSLINNAWLYGILNDEIEKKIAAKYNIEIPIMRENKSSVLRKK